MSYDIDLRNKDGSVLKMPGNIAHIFGESSMKHVPFQTPRDERGAFYLSLWQETSEDVDFLVNQRAANVAASFIMFMATNTGLSFTRDASDSSRYDHFTTKQDAFIAQWGLRNQRIEHINHGLRWCEFMLATHYPISETNHVDWAKVPNVTMDDMETLECMVRYWADEHKRYRKAYEKFQSDWAE